MQKIWWPEPFYEVRPWGALALGSLGGLFAAVRAWARADWDLLFAAGLLAGLLLVAYGGVVLHLRFDYRRRSRWYRERRR
ncbi:MAG: hypothetical protein FJ191_09425 [Gammaproteobacteria bacterium]|nr:hypothetical protein [Gammaproteobacteria bacterium]